MRRMVLALAVLFFLPLKVHAGGADLVWAKGAGGVDWDYGSGIAALSDGSALVTGGFGGSATFGSGEAEETTLISAGGEDIFIARYNPDGTLAWAKRAGGREEQGDQGNDIATFADGSALVTGCFWGSATFGSGEAGETTLTAADAYQIFIALYNSDGTLAWAKRAGGGDWANGNSIAALPDGSALVTGLFSGNGTFGPGETRETTLTSSGEYDIFIARYNPDGTLAWVKRAGGEKGDSGAAIAVLSDGSSVLTGTFESSATFGPDEPAETTLTSTGYTDLFVARYNSDGTLAWAKSTSGIYWANGFGIAALADGSALVTGRFSGNTTFGPGEAGAVTLTSAGDRDIFIARYSPEGTFMWAKRAGGVDWDYGSRIAALPDGSALVTGCFSYSATFGPGETGETTLTSPNGFEIFIACYNPDGRLAVAKRVGGRCPGGVFGDMPPSIAALSDDSVLMTGAFMGNATFGIGEADEITLATAGLSDICIARFGSPLYLEPSQLTAGCNFTLDLSLLKNINTAFDFYLLANTQYGAYSLYLDGRVMSGINALYKNIPRYPSPFTTMVRPQVTLPATMGGQEVTFYAVVVKAGKMPPVSNLLELTPDTLYVIMMDKKTVTVAY